MQGICFVEPLFHATVEGRKTQTRRIMKPQTDDIGLHNHTEHPMSVHHSYNMEGFWGTVEETGESKQFKPRYKVGETVYLKEPYYITNYLGGIMDSEWKKSIKYKYGTKYENYTWEWSKKLFMPAGCARYFIEIAGVKAERLQYISDEDCLREGIIEKDWECASTIHSHLVDDGYFYLTEEDSDKCYSTPQQAYATLIDSINGKGTWESNPYVWVYDYRLVNKYFDEILEDNKDILKRLKDN